MSSKPSEELAARWLGGRGTAVLYFAIILAIVGVLVTAQGMAQAREDREKAVELASQVQTLCVKTEFREANSGVCQQAAHFLANPGSSPIPADSKYVFVMDTSK